MFNLKSFFFQVLLIKKHPANHNPTEKKVNKKKTQTSTKKNSIET